ncbi:MAG TPA: MnhB domain-containing protein [Rhodopila sp.]|nr:MnhB domain-containing protein [Rhodopila sp.]
MRRLRIVLFAVGALLLLGPVGAVVRAMPAFGGHPLPYGDAINRDAPAQRHVSNSVSAVNFDYRGFDTLGEEFMLVCAVTGTAMLLRGARGESLTAEPGVLPGRPLPRRTEAVMLIGRVMGPFTMMFGLYVVLHAMVTPGGGFQGGVIIASGLLLLFLGEGYQGWRRLMRTRWLEACEGGGALVFALAGLVPMLTGAAFLQNVLPYGRFRDMLSGGLMQIVNAGVACAVMAGFSLVLLEFLEETRAPEPEG